MPQVTVYVREDDIEQWKCIEKKSEFIHDALIMAKLPPEVLRTAMKPKNIKLNNIKVNDDNTISPIDPKKPSSFTTEAPVPKKEFVFPPSAASQLKAPKTVDEVKAQLAREKELHRLQTKQKPGNKEVVPVEERAARTASYFPKKDFGMDPVDKKERHVDL